MVGGGPAGLFCAALFKTARPAHDVTVFERDRVGWTYGWGVVLSENGLRAVRAADPLTYERLGARQVEFDSIEVRLRGKAIRAGGHVYSAIGRQELLAILQRRCGELGVDCRYDAEIRPPFDLHDFDLVIGADGVRSVVRRASAEFFRPRVEPDELKYVWLGTPRDFGALTITARESEHGWFQAHAYPYDREMSTFLVFCREGTWRCAGLDGGGERETIAYCEDVFAGDLAGCPLLPNSSHWNTFQSISCARWHHDGAVLIGDAAHTLHPTIGSGTRLALEDAAALALAVGDGGDLEAAIRRYERERQPAARRFQAAAAESREHFEHLERYVHLAPEQFALHMLTRTERIDYEELRRRDPNFIRCFEQGLGAACAGDGESERVAAAPVEMPLRLRERTFRDRVVLAPRGWWSCDAGEGPDQEYVERLLAAAGAQPAAVLVGAVRVLPSTGARRRAAPEAPAAGRSSWPELVRRLRCMLDARLIVRLTGERQGPEDRAAASLSFVHAAEAAARAGFDVVELDLGAELVHDAVWGLQLVRAVRAACPSSMLVAVAIPRETWRLEGPALAATVKLTGRLGVAGCDLVHLVSAGSEVPAAEAAAEHLLVVSRSDRIRNESSIATMIQPPIRTASALNTIIGSGRADLCITAAIDPEVA